jgi:hypothetical protein
MVDEHSLQLLKEVCIAVAAVATAVTSIVRTLYDLGKLAPGWPRHVFAWVNALSHALFSIAGIVALISNYYLLALGLFLLGFLVEVIRFVRNATPLDRKAVMGFSISCCSFVFSVIMVLLAYTIRAILDVLKGQAETIADIIEILKKLSH